MEETGMTASVRPIEGIYETEDMALMQAAIDAVCNELNITSADHGRREAVASSILMSWTAGGRMPLNLVQAGLSAS
jgi:hypothetical protein